MSAHSAQADICPGCGHRFNFIVYHLKYCKFPIRPGIRQAITATGDQGRENIIAHRRTR